MPSFSSVDWTEDGVGNPIKMHANRELITDVLKGKIGFDGFVISDWEGIHQIPGDWATQVRTGVNAGIDMFMEPNSAKPFEDTLLAEVNAGRVPMSRIDDAVSRILAKKFELGLFEQPYTDRTNLAQVGSPSTGARPRGGREVAGAAEELRRRCRLKERQASTSPAATPTTWATRRAAGRSAGRVRRASTGSRATRSWTASGRSLRARR